MNLSYWWPLPGPELHSSSPISSSAITTWRGLYWNRSLQGWELHSTFRWSKRVKSRPSTCLLTMLALAARYCLKKEEQVSLFERQGVIRLNVPGHHSWSAKGCGFKDSSSAIALTYYECRKSCVILPAQKQVYGATKSFIYFFPNACERNFKRITSRWVFSARVVWTPIRHYAHE